jgi:WD40 repeat protein
MPGVTAEAPRAKTELPVRWQIDVGDYAVDAAISHDGSLAAIGTGAGNVVVLDIETGAERWRTLAHAGGIAAVAFSPRQVVLATAGPDGRARLFRSDGTVQAELPAQGAWVEHLAWSPDGTRLATTSARVLRLWTASGAPLLETEPHASTVAGVAWAKDGRRVATCCYGGVHIWTVDGPVQARHFAWKGSLISMAWSPDGKVIACGSQDASVHFWRVANGQDSEMRGFPFKPKALAWDTGSSMLATGGDATITVWKFLGKGPEGKPPQQLEGHKLVCTTLAFAPKSGLLASGGQDTGVLVWEPHRGSKPLRFGFMEEEVTKLAWHPGGKGLLGADAGGQVRYFDTGA